jgi:hypothetical protein
MGAKPAVLIGNQHLDVVGIHIIERHRKPPDAAFVCIGAQQFAVPVDDLPRNIGGLFQRRRKGPIQPVQHEGGKTGQEHEGSQPDACPPPGAHAGLGLHGDPSTSMKPVAVRAANSGRYMSSTTAAG